MEKQATTTVVARLLISASLFTASQLQAADDPQANVAKPGCTLKRKASIDLQGPLGNVVQMKIGDKPVLMVLNTSLTTSLILSPEVKRFKWPTHEFSPPINVAGGPVTTAVDLDELEIGSVRYTRTSFLVFQTTHEMGDIDGVPLIGNLGMDVLGNVDFELDIGHRKLILFTHNDCAGNVVYWTDNFASAPIHKGQYGEVYFDIELDGQKIEATFNSASSSSQLYTDVSKKLYGFDEKSKGNEMEKTKKGKPAYYYRAMKMTAPGLSITNERMQLSRPFTKCTVSIPSDNVKGAGYSDCKSFHPLQLGLPVLSKLRIYFAMKDGAIYYSNADATR